MKEINNQVSVLSESDVQILAERPAVESERELNMPAPFVALSVGERDALCATVKALRADVDRFSTLADERHDRLSAERRENDNLRQQRAQLSGRVKQVRQCVVDVGKETAELQSQLAALREERDYWRTQATEASKAAEKWYHERN